MNKMHDLPLPHNRGTRKNPADLSKFCKDYLDNKEQFRWFIEKYFGLEKYVELWNLARDNEEDHLRSELERIWFELPDSMFNIRIAPPGWRTFVFLLEN